MALVKDVGGRAVLLNTRRICKILRDDTLQELGNFDSSTPILASQKMFMTIDLRGTLQAASIQVQMECREYHSSKAT
jgi:hypothetical protein